MTTTSLKIEGWSLSRLIPYARNARTHSDAQVAQIAGSIAAFGFNNPVLVDPAGGIIAGHGRVLAARKLGLTEVPIIVLGHLSENEKRAFMIADNKLALNAGWDEEMLRLELQALAEQAVNAGQHGIFGLLPSRCHHCLPVCSDTLRGVFQYGLLHFGQTRGS
jgi:ParB-like chromosome segregation protein Spo0J